VENKKKCMQKWWGNSMKKQVMIIVLILFIFSLFAGWIYVNPQVQAGEQKGTPDQTLAIQVCQVSCKNYIKYFPLGCICP
jgi:hypothetical protein